MSMHALVGDTAAAAYTHILLSHSEVQGCTVFNYRSPPRLHERVDLTREDQLLIDSALLLRAQTKLPFWEAVFAICAFEQKCSERLICGALFHNGQGLETKYSRADLQQGILGKLTLEQQSNVALGSALINSCGQERHLGLLDFHAEISDQNTPIIRAVCRELMPGGFVILDSGDSYHASTLNLLSPQERVHLLGRALLLSPIVDVAYIGHQLQQSSNSIRMSRGGRAKKVPTVVDVWEPQA